MRYVGTFLNAKGQQVRRTFEARDEESLRQRLEQEGLKVQELKVDGTLEVADAHAILDISSRIISAIVVLLTVALVFSIPFPFVQKIWYGETFGYYGLMNIGCFAIIAWGLRRMSIIAVIAGIAILLYEQLLTWNGFYHFAAQGPITRTALGFVALATLLTLILLFVFLKAFHAIHLYYDVKRAFHRRNESSSTLTRSYGLRLSLFGLYLGVPLMVYFVPFEVLPPYEIMAAMRLLGEVTCLISAAGIGYEIQRVFKGHAWTVPTFFIIIFHTTALFVISYWLYLKVPFKVLFRALS